MNTVKFGLLESCWKGAATFLCVLLCAFEFESWLSEQLSRRKLELELEWQRNQNQNRNERNRVASLTSSRSRRQLNNFSLSLPRSSKQSRWEQANFKLSLQATAPTTLPASPSPPSELEPFERGRSLRSLTHLACQTAAVWLATHEPPADQQQVVWSS